MINRNNWLVFKEYLKYLSEVKNLATNSVRMYESLLRLLLRWADDVSFAKAYTIRPTFPKHLTEIEYRGKPLSPSYVKKAVRTSKRFFYWLSLKSEYSSITEDWLNTLVAPRMVIEPKNRDVVTFEYIQELSKAPVDKLRERRIRASAVFWFLSGVRIGAFCTLPIKAIDLDKRLVLQWPRLGVKTKNSVHATTNLLNIPELIDVVREWDREVKRNLSEDNLWFAALDPETFEFVEDHDVGKHRHARARKDLKEWVERVGLPYYSPHKFRHGHATYALSKAVTVADLKAISQNLMHSNLTITDGVYAILSEDDLSERIGNLGNGQSESKEAIIHQLESILVMLKK